MEALEEGEEAPRIQQEEGEEERPETDRRRAKEDLGLEEMEREEAFLCHSALLLASIAERASLAATR